eukprot:6481172-Amphidinium_carterae.1
MAESFAWVVVNSLPSSAAGRLAATSASSHAATDFQQTNPRPHQMGVRLRSRLRSRLPSPPNDVVCLLM